MPATQMTNNYRETQVMSASPMELVLMLYDECIRNLGEAEKAFAIGGPDRFQQINSKMLHAQDVITELAVSLDLDQGGEFAQNMNRLYDFMVNHLSEAHIEKSDVAPVIAVKELMMELKEAWEEVADKAPATEHVHEQSDMGRVLAAG